MSGSLSRDGLGFYFFPFYFLGENLTGRRSSDIIMTFNMEPGIELNLKGKVWMRIA